MFEVPPEAKLPTVSRVLHLRARGHVGLHSRASKDHELHFVSRGHLRIEFEDTAIVVSAGQMLYTGPPMRYGITGDVPDDLSCFHCHFSLPGARVTRMDEGSWTERASSADAFAAGRDRRICLPRVWTIRKPAGLTEQFLALMADQRGRHPGDSIAAEGRFLLLLRSIAGDAVDMTVGRPSPAIRTARTHVARALDQIEHFPGRRATLSGIASILGIEPEHLARLFRQQVGCSLGSYATRRAMALARERLLSEPTSIKDIGRSLGYQDPLYFSRVFKREVGCSPREFRNRTLR